MKYITIGTPAVEAQKSHGRPLLLHNAVLLRCQKAPYEKPSEAKCANVLARQRVSDGQKAVSIDLGMVVSDGVVAETNGMLDSLRRRGWFMEVSQDEVLALLDHYCNPSTEILTPDTCQVIVGIEGPSAMKQKDIDIPPWMHRPLFRHFHHTDTVTASSTGAAGTGAGDSSALPSYADLLRQTRSSTDAAAKITDWLAAKVARALGHSVFADVDTAKPLQAYGVDSLIAIDIRNWLRKEMGADVPVFDILGQSSVVGLSEIVAANSEYVGERGGRKPRRIR